MVLNRQQPVSYTGLVAYKHHGTSRQLHQNDWIMTNSLINTVYVDQARLLAVTSHLTAAIG